MRKLFESRVAAVAVGATVIVSLGATGAVAADMITSDDIRNQSIRSADIERNGVGASELRHGSVRSGDIRDGAVHLRGLSDWVADKVREAGQRGPRGPQGPAGPPGDSASYHGENWSIIDRNVIGDADASLRSGPSSAAFGLEPTAPPLGIGSLGIRTASGSDKVAFGNQVDFVGDAVLELEELSYSVFTTGENIDQGPNNMPSIIFEIDPNLESAPGDDYSSMVFAPANTTAGWTTIDALDEANGAVWGLTGQSVCNMNGSRCTWSKLKEGLNDGDGVPPTIHTVAISKGRDYAFSGAVDALSINGEVFDFEPFGVK